MWQRVVELWESFTREQRISVLLLGICGALALGLSIYRVRANVLEPFLVDKSEILETKNIIGLTPDEQAAKQKRTDTDGDSLSDWDETNVYRTNPNLRDTCGDGTPDNIRIITGKNLNCDAGRAPGSGVLNADNGAATTTVNARGIESLYQDLSGLPGGQVGVPSASEANSQLLPRDPVLIREALKGKVDQAKLDALSDEMLLQYYDEALAIQAAASQTTSTSP